MEFDNVMYQTLFTVKEKKTFPSHEDNEHIFYPVRCAVYTEGSFSLIHEVLAILISISAYV